MGLETAEDWIVSFLKPGRGWRRKQTQKTDFSFFNISQVVEVLFCFVFCFGGKEREVFLVGE